MLSRLKEKVHKILATKPHLGGLEISHSSIKYLAIKGSRSIQQASVKLPPGVIEQGKIIDATRFADALKNLHEQIAGSTVTVNIILVIPSSLVYVQAFSVPIMAPAEQEEAIDLNLQMISPGRVEESYYDWQEIKKNDTAGHVDLLGAFTGSLAVDAFVGALNAANFNVVSVEFPGLALSRLIKERWQVSVENTQHVLLYINSEGVLVSILKNANLYFSHFTPWNDIVLTSTEREITFADIEAFIEQEIRRVTTFYLSKTGHTISEIILISPFFNYEITELAEKRLKMGIKNLTIKELPDLSPSWFPALGAGLRGLIPRSKDAFLSLAHISAKAEYYQERTLSLIALCRNIIVGAFIFVFIASLTVDGVLYRSEQARQEASPIMIAPAEAELVQQLRAEATSFNQLVEIAHIAKAKEVTWSALFDALKSVTGTNINITRIYADRNNLSLIVTGTATNELAAINFKGRVEKIPTVKTVSLPLSQIQPSGTDAVSFSLTATLSSL